MNYTIMMSFRRAKRETSSSTDDDDLIIIKKVLQKGNHIHRLTALLEHGRFRAGTIHYILSSSHSTTTEFYRISCPNPCAVLLRRLIVHI